MIGGCPGAAIFGLQGRAWPTSAFWTSLTRAPDSGAPSLSCERCATSAPGVLRAASWTIAVSIGGTAARASHYAPMCRPYWVYYSAMSVPATCPVPAVACGPHGCCVCLLILRRRMRPGPASFLIRATVPGLPPSPIRCSWQCPGTLLPSVTSPVCTVSGQVFIFLHHSSAIPC